MKQKLPIIKYIISTSETEQNNSIYLYMYIYIIPLFESLMLEIVQTYFVVSIQQYKYRTDNLAEDSINNHRYTPGDSISEQNNTYKHIYLYNIYDGRCERETTPEKQYHKPIHTCLLKINTRILRIQW